MSQAGAAGNAAGGGFVTSVTGTDGITAVPTTGNVVIETRGAGTGNTFLGQSAGNATLSGSNNTSLGFDSLNAITSASNAAALGSNALKSLTTGISNTAVGNGALGALTTGAANVAIGRGVLSGLITGSTNTAIGINSGSVYTGAESGNILLGNNLGTIGDNNVLAIGSSTTSTCFITGIFGVSTTSPQVVTVDSSTNQMGSSLSPSVQRPIVSVTNSTKTFGLTDANTFQDCNRASSQTLTVDTNANVPFPVGTEIDVYQEGAGQVIFAAAGGVTIESAFSNLKIATQHTGASLKYLGSDVWALVGNLTA